MTECFLWRVGKKNWKGPPLLSERAPKPFQLKGGGWCYVVVVAGGFLGGFGRKLANLNLRLCLHFDSSSEQRFRLIFSFSLNM